MGGAAVVAAKRRPHQRGAIVIWSLIGVVAWLTLTAYAGFVAFVNVFAVSYTGYARAHSRVNPDDAAKVDNLIAGWGVGYSVACALLICLVLWLTRRMVRQGAS